MNLDLLDLETLRETVARVVASGTWASTRYIATAEGDVFDEDTEDFTETFFEHPEEHFCEMINNLSSLVEEANDTITKLMRCIK